MSTKKDKTNLSEVFTINLDSFSESGEIPGVTQLLNPAKLAEKAAEKAAVAKKKKEIDDTKAAFHAAPQASPRPSQAIAKPAAAVKKELKDFSVLFDFHFINQNETFHFHQARGHSEEIQPWQKEILAGMKIDLKTLFFKGSFQEFRFEMAGYLYAALGLQNRHFIQLVQNPKDQTLHVLVSTQSQIANQSAIQELVNASVSEDSGKIELDLAS
jgi:hypothetical protein